MYCPACNGVLNIEEHDLTGSQLVPLQKLHLSKES